MLLIKSERFILVAILAMSCLIPFQLDAYFLNDSNNRFVFCASAELGFLKVLSHKIQFSRNGTRFDYVKDGGQDILFPFSTAHRGTGDESSAHLDFFDSTA